MSLPNAATGYLQDLTELAAVNRSLPANTNNNTADLEGLLIQPSTKSLLSKSTFSDLSSLDHPSHPKNIFFPSSPSSTFGWKPDVRQFFADKPLFPCQKTSKNSAFPELSLLYNPTPIFKASEKVPLAQRSSGSVIEWNSSFFAEPNSHWFPLAELKSGNNSSTFADLSLLDNPVPTEKDNLPFASQLRPISSPALNWNLVSGESGNSQSPFSEAKIEAANSALLDLNLLNSSNNSATNPTSTQSLNWNTLSAAASGSKLPTQVPKDNSFLTDLSIFDDVATAVKRPTLDQHYFDQFSLSNLKSVSKPMSYSSASASLDILEVDKSSRPPPPMKKSAPNSQLNCNSPLSTPKKSTTSSVAGILSPPLQILEVSPVSILY